MKTIQYIIYIAVVLTLASCSSNEDELSESTTCSATGKVYVANTGANTLSVINSSEDAVCKTITVGSSPRIWRINKTSQRLYVNNRTSNTISVIDTSTDNVIATIQVGSDPSAVTEDTTRSRLYVANRGSNSVSVIDTSTNQVLANGTVGLIPGSAPHKVKVNKTTNLIYVLHANTNVSIIDGNDLTLTPPVIAVASFDSTPPLGRLIIKEGAEKIFVTLGDDTYGGVSIIDVNTNEPLTLTVEAKPRRIRSYGDTIYVVNQDGNSVSSFPVDASSDADVTTFGVGIDPRDLRLNTTTNLLYVSNRGSDTVSVIDTTNSNSWSLVTTVGVGNAPNNVIINKSLNKIYVSNSGTNNNNGTTVSVIDGSNHTVIKTITVGLKPGSMRVIE